MKKLLVYLLKAIVPHPEDIKVEEAADKITFLVSAHPEDIKIIIGKNGRTIKAIREIVNIKALLNKQKIFIKIKD